MWYSKNSFIAAGRKKAIVIDANTMDLIKAIDINTNLSNLEDCKPHLLLAHVFPETECRFVLETWDTQMITMRTVETGVRQVLV